MTKTERHALRNAPLFLLRCIVATFLAALAVLVLA